MTTKVRVDSPPAGLKLAYGGVVVDEGGRVLLREVANHWDDYVWTFAKGRADSGESPEEAALREVREELGVVGSIAREIPGWFLGGTTVNKYWLMRLSEDLGHFHWETASRKWVTPAEARELIALTTNRDGKPRDLTVLDAAMALWAELPG